MIGMLDNRVSRYSRYGIEMRALRRAYVAVVVPVLVMVKTSVVIVVAVTVTVEVL